jgi:hypothetical protein
MAEEKGVFPGHFIHVHHPACADVLFAVNIDQLLNPF